MEVGCGSVTVLNRLKEYDIPRRRGGVEHWSDEQKNLRSDWNKAHPEINRMKGKHHTTETKQKMSEERKGEKNAHWKGGYTEEYLKAHRTATLNKRRLECYQRDNFTCRVCGLKPNSTRKLHAHHIVPWGVSRDDSLSNLLTTCRECHRKIEGKPQESANHQ
jgi:5-methylcytosine-specific restriction endonuclease McrA